MKRAAVNGLRNELKRFYLPGNTNDSVSYKQKIEIERIFRLGNNYDFFCNLNHCSPLLSYSKTIFKNVKLRTIDCCVYDSRR